MPSWNLAARFFPAFSILISLLIVSLFTVQVFIQYISDRSYLGIVFNPTEQGILIDKIIPYSPAAKAGLPQGALIQSINGIQIKSLSDILAGINFNQHNQAIIEVKENGQNYTYLIQIGRSVNYHRLTLNALVIFIYLSMAYTAARLVYISRGVYLLAWFSLLVAFDIAISLNSAYLFEISNQLAFVRQFVASLEFSLIFHLASITPKRAFWARPRYTPYLFYIFIPGIHSLFSAIDYQLIHADAYLTQWVQQAFKLNLPAFSWGVLIVSALGYQFIKAQDNREKKQVFWLILAVLPWFIWQSIHVLYPDITQLETYEFFNDLVRFLFPIFIFVSIFRYNLLNLSDLFPRHIFHLIISGSILLLLTSLVIELALRFSDYFNTSSLIWITGLSCLFIGLSYSWVHRLIESICYNNRQYPNLGKELRILADKISELDSLDKIRYTIVTRLSKLLQSKHIVLLFDQDMNSKKQVFWPSQDKILISLNSLRFDKFYTPIQLSNYEDKDKKLSYLYTKGLELIIPLHHNYHHIGSLLIGRHIAGHRYLWKDIELLHLFSQNIATKIMNTQLNHQIQYDALTGLLRREIILSKLEQGILKVQQNHQEQNRHLSIAMIDLDHFKQLNDTYGHLFGDQALEKVAHVAQECLPPNCALGRFGGEEFLLLMPDYGLYCAKILAEKIRQSIADIQLDNCHLSVSIGLAEIKEIKNYLHLPVHVLMRQLIDLADKNLYQAKEKGRNQVFCSPSIVKSCCPYE